MLYNWPKSLAAERKKVVIYISLDNSPGGGWVSCLCIVRLESMGKREDWLLEKVLMYKVQLVREQLL